MNVTKQIAYHITNNTVSFSCKQFITILLSHSLRRQNRKHDQHSKTFIPLSLSRHQHDEM